MQEILFASCDAVYYERFGRSFINSAIANGHNVHIHLINPYIGMSRISHPKLSYSIEENSPESRAYYAANRFLVIPDILIQTSEVVKKILILDIDAVVRKPIPFPDSAVGLYLRESFGANEWEKRGTRVAAGIVMYDNTSWLFAKKVADKINTLPNQWFSDQIALAETYDEYKDNMNIHDFSKNAPPIVDWEFREKSIIWSAKGNRKDDPVFIAEQKKYAEMLI